MRVAIDAAHGSAGSIWGSSLYVRELLAQFARRPPAEAEVEALVGPAKLPEFVWEQLLLARALRRGKFDVVHAPNCFLPSRRPCAGVVTVHDLAFEEHRRDFAPLTALKYRRFAPLAVRSAQRVICPSHFTATDVCARYGADPRLVCVIPQAPVLARGSLEPPPGPYLLCVGALREKKNVARLLEAFREMRAAGLPQRLVIAGPDAGARAQLERIAVGLPVEFAGALADDRLDALLRGAQALVAPSLYEGFGLVVVEAMARGTPVAVSQGTALAETAGVAGVTFDPLDPGSIAATLIDLLSDDARRERLGAAGRERARAYSWERTARETVAAYAGAADEFARASGVERKRP